MNKTKMVFWEYDQFPFLLWAESDSQLGKMGDIFIPSYGGYIKPLAIIDLKEGRVLANELSDLTLRRRRHVEEIENMFQGQLKYIKNRLMEKIV